MQTPVKLSTLGLPPYTIITPRKYDAKNPSPGTRIAVYPTAETATNILNWGWDNDIDIPRAPYGLLHITALATARTLDMPVVRFNDPLLIPPAEIRLRIIRDHQRRDVLWAALNNPVLNHVIAALHRAAGVMPQSPPHMTLSYRIRGANRLTSQKTLPFAIGLRSMTVGAFSVGLV